jgi:hypothetical protein
MFTPTRTCFEEAMLLVHRQDPVAFYLGGFGDNAFRQGKRVIKEPFILNPIAKDGS